MSIVNLGTRLQRVVIFRLRPLYNPSYLDIVLCESPRRYRQSRVRSENATGLTGTRTAVASKPSHHLATHRYVPVGEQVHLNSAQNT